jgi:hypothetical protein
VKLTPLNAHAPTPTTPFGIVIEVIAGFIPEKAPPSICLRLSGSVNEVNAVIPANAPPPIYETLFPNVTDSIELERMNASSRICVTLFEMETEVMVLLASDI